MTSLLVATLIFITVFLFDYFLFLLQGNRYKYASVQTLAVFLGGQIAIISLFYAEFSKYFEHLDKEFFYLSLLLIATVGFTYTLVRDKLIVCHVTSRTERCLTPSYVVVKGTEIIFQQLCYLAIALSLVSILGFTILTFLAFIQILLIIHTPVVLSCNKPVVARLTFGIGIIAAPILFIFVDVGYFFPAVYLHTLLYVFYWLTFADFEPYDHLRVENRG